MVWIVSCYSVITALFSYVRVLTLLVNDPMSPYVPAYQHLYFYLLPTLQLLAGVTLFFLKKAALPLYVAYFVGLVTLPAVLSTIVAGPYHTPDWLSGYRNYWSH